jgi:hypothetical protein
MKLKFIFAFALMIGLLSAGVIFVPQDTLYFKYLPHGPTIDGSHEFDEGVCNSISPDDLTVRYCYFNKKLYFYFFISDTESDDGDYLHLGFDTDKDETLEKGEPRIIIYRNGSVVNPDNWIFVKSTTGRGGWRGELLVPFEDVGLPIFLGPGKWQSGPNIRLKAVGGSEGSLGTFYGSGVGETQSVYYWSQPKSFDVDPTSFGNPTQDWIRETDNNTIKMLEFSIGSNNEEPFNINYLVFDATGTGHEEDDIQSVDLYMINGPTTELVGSKSFNHDNGNMMFPVNFDVQGTHTGSNAPVFQLFYVMDPNAGSVGGSAASFRVDLIDVPNVGGYTAAELQVNNLPFKSGSLFTYDCATDSGCSGDEFCDNNKCTDVIPATACGYAANHIWNDYECCSDSDCSSSYVCSSHLCVEESTAPPPDTSDPDPEPTDPTPDPVIIEPPLANVTAPPVPPEENDSTNESGTPPTSVPDENASVIAPPPNATAPGTPPDNQTGDIGPKEEPKEEDNTLIYLGAAILVIAAAVIYYFKFMKVKK